ncbi:2TM domain-containing protein [Chitinimonas sp. BJYL2]|uniref:2TM domain-containing protein n=1 Tax=Chitinimonas sp. BJYL2 TaxID=2976696 RepID=UPI0022B40920|nr:2TM domain-containing protein [Chitinimonas sp. BJYL2]
MSTQDLDSLRRRAEARINARLKFYANAGTFAAVSLFLMALNWWLEGRITWAVWPVMGMTLGLTFQAIHLWLRTDLLREGMIEREMQKLREGK